MAQGDRSAQLAEEHTRDLRNNPPALRHYNLGEMWRTPQAKWVGIQYALYIGCSLFGVAYYYWFAKAMGLGSIVAAVGFAGFALADGIFRPVYGISPNSSGAGER